MDCLSRYGHYLTKLALHRPGKPQVDRTDGSNRLDETKEVHAAPVDAMDIERSNPLERRT